MSTTTTKPRHFPKKGERLIDGAWVMPAPEKPVRPVETAADRRNYLRRMAGWPPMKEG